MPHFRLVSYAAVALLVALPVIAQEATPRERELQQRVDTLESRLSDMESVVNELREALEASRAESPAPPSSPPTPSAPPAKAASVDASSGPVPLEAYFNKGLQIRSKDGAFDIRVAGRTQFDLAFFDADERWERLAALNPDFGLGDEQDGLSFRRARLSIRGKIYDNMGFKAQYDFVEVGESGHFRDVFFDFLDVPWFDKIRIGHFQEPFSLEEMTSNNYITFMERSLANTFSPSFNTGVTVEKSLLKGRPLRRCRALQRYRFLPLRQ